MSRWREAWLAAKFDYHMAMLSFEEPLRIVWIGDRQILLGVAPIGYGEICMKAAILTFVETLFRRRPSPNGRSGERAGTHHQRRFEKLAKYAVHQAGCDWHGHPWWGWSDTAKILNCTCGLTALMDTLRKDGLVG